MLRAGLLEGIAVLVACADAERPGSAEGGGAAVREVCVELGARVATCCPIVAHADVEGVVPAEEAELDAVVSATGALDLLAVDGAGLFAAGLAHGGSGHAALRACVDGAWNATRAVVNHAFLATAERGGRIVYLAPAPAPDAGEHAGAACAGLENLARTLSIEWARHGITTVTIAPGTQTTAGEAATLVAYLASPAGAYFSGCLLDLRGGF